MSAEPRHVLYVAWGFPPAKSGGVFRMMETANVLVEQGWQVTVLACDIDDLRRYAGVDLSTLDGVSPDLRVVRVGMDLGPFETDLHRWDEKRVDDPAGWLAEYQARVDAGFPNSVYALWEEPLLAAARAVHAERPLDLVVASGGPFVCFAAGLALRREHGVPFVMDYRDSWSLQQFTEEQLHGPGSRVHEVEGDLLASAAEVWFVNEPMRQWHEEVYPQVVGKSRVVTNGYDADVLTGLPLPKPRSASVRFGYLGTVTTAVPLAETLEGYRLARQQDPALHDSTFDFYGYLGFYPTPHEGIHKQILDAAPDAVTWRGALPKAEVATAYGRMDALVLTFGGIRYVTSGKVFEYMATARPIVSVHAPQNAVRDVLRGYPLWFQAASLSASDVAEAFSAAAESVRSGRAADPTVVADALAHAARFERRRCLRQAVDDLAQTASFARATVALHPVDADVVACVGRVEPQGFRTWVARAGRRLVVVDPTPSPTGSAVEISGSTGSPEGPSSRDVAADPTQRLSFRQQTERLRFAEPGTVLGRLRRLYAIAAEQADRDLPDFDRHIDLAERLVASGAGAIWGVANRDLEAVTWVTQAVPGTAVLVAADAAATSADLEDGPVAAGAGATVLHGPAALIGTATPQDKIADSVRSLLAVPPPPRLRQRQDPVEGETSAAAADPAPRSGATAEPVGGTAAGGLVVTSLQVAPGSAVLELAEAIARQSGEEVWVLARSGPRQRRRASSRRQDSRLGRIRIIRVPLSTATDALPPKDWRHRGGAWRDRRITVQAPLALRVAHVQYAKRIRAWAEERPSPMDPVLIALTRAGTGVFRALGAADQAVDALGRRVSNLHDKVDAARHGVPTWTELFPETRSLEEAYAPLLDRLEWDTLHVADPGAIDVARAAVERRRGSGRPARWVRHLRDDDSLDAAAEVPLRQRLAYRALTVSVDADEGIPLPPAVHYEDGEGPAEQPWPRGDLPAMIGIGAYNMAGQAWAWAKAIERTAPGVRTEVLTIDRGSHLTYESDIVVPLQTFTDDADWARRFESHVLDSWTHALIEGGRSILGTMYGRNYINNAKVLDEVGIAVALLFHGSDLRDPRLHASRTPWSPFSDPEDELVRSLQARRDVLGSHFLDFDGPKWVSTPDLLADLPGAQWLPVVVDVARWASDTTPMERPVPVVVHVPSRTRMKGTALVEAALEDLRSEGAIDYRRMEGVPPSQMARVIGNSDIVLDQFVLGSYGVAAVEAMAAGRVVLGHVMDDVRELCAGLPVVEATPATIVQVLRDLLADRERAREIAAEGPRYAARVHDGRVSGTLLVDALRPAVRGSSRGRLAESPRLSPADPTRPLPG